MNDDELLGSALSEKLQELVSDVEPSPSLTAWVDREFGGSRPSWRGRALRSLRKRRLAISVPAVAVVAAVVAVIVFSGSDSQPAFAVVKEADGTVEITLRDVQAIAGANAKLRALGVDNIAVVPVRAGCASDVSLTYYGVDAHQGGSTIHLTPSKVPGNSTLILAAKQITPRIIEFGQGTVTGAVPSCVAPGQTGPGIPAGSVSTPSGP